MVAVIVAALAFFWWLVFVFAWLIFLFFTITIARSKGHSALLWGLLACFIPLITIIVLLVIPYRSGNQDGGRAATLSGAPAPI